MDFLHFIEGIGDYKNKEWRKIVMAKYKITSNQELIQWSRYVIHIFTIYNVKIFPSARSPKF